MVKKQTGRVISAEGIDLEPHIIKLSLNQFYRQGKIPDFTLITVIQHEECIKVENYWRLLVYYLL